MGLILWNLAEDRGMDGMIPGGPCQIQEPGSLISVIVGEIYWTPPGCSELC